MESIELCAEGGGQGPVHIFQTHMLILQALLQKKGTWHSRRLASLRGSLGELTAARSQIFAFVDRLNEPHVRLVRVTGDVRPENESECQDLSSNNTLGSNHLS